MSNGLRNVVLAALAALCLTLAFVRSEPVAEPAVQTANRAAAASLGVYVALRSINAALSFAQEIEVGGSFGVSANAQPMKFLEPIDDTVERVASVIFLIALLAGVLSIGIAPVASLGFLLLALGLAISAFRGPLKARAGRLADPVCRTGNACSGVGVFLALVIPVSLVLGSVLGTELTRVQWDAAQSDLSQISNHATELLGGSDAAAPPTSESEPTAGTLQRFWDNVTSAGEGVSDAVGQTEAYLEAAGYFVDRADDLLNASLAIVAIFLLRTLVLPVTLMLVLMVVARQLFLRP